MHCRLYSVSVLDTYLFLTCHKADTHLVWGGYLDIWLVGKMPVKRVVGNKLPVLELVYLLDQQFSKWSH